MIVFTAHYIILAQFCIIFLCNDDSLYFSGIHNIEVETEERYSQNPQTLLICFSIVDYFNIICRVG